MPTTLHLGRTDMIRIDGFFLYSSGYSLHPLEGMKVGDSFLEWFPKLAFAEQKLEGILGLGVRTSYARGIQLLDAIRAITADPDRRTPLGAVEIVTAISALKEFESVLAAELSIADFYLVTRKAGYDTTQLVLNGTILFPQDLPRKVPEAVEDVVQGARCIAFELPTAAGFHLHRANESILHRYYDAVTNGAPRPVGRNMGDFLAELNRKNAGSPAVRSALKDLKDLHRNPLIHPEHSLESVDEAIALLGSIHAVVVHMLRTIPEIQPDAPKVVA
jgi:hypothetical protein